MVNRNKPLQVRGKEREIQIERLIEVVRDLELKEYDLLQVYKNRKLQQHPFIILPEEVWKIIFLYLENSTEVLHNVCKASSILGTLLDFRKPIWLFEKILPYIGKENLKKKDVLNCRLVCKHWKRALDNYMEDHPYLHPFQHREKGTAKIVRDSCVQGKPDSFFIGGIRFDGPWGAEKIDRFREDIKFNHHPLTNPVIGRCLTINFRNTILDITEAEMAPIIEGFYESLMNFLEIHGSHIWHFGLDDSASCQYSPHKLYVFLQKLLTSLPNLRTLELCLGVDKRKSELENTDRTMWLFMGRNPLPAMAHLTTFHLQLENASFGNKIGFQSIQNTVMCAYSAQLQSLRCPLELWSSYHWRGLINLSELVLDDDEGSRLPDTTMAKFCTLMSGANAPNLQKLEVELPSKTVKVKALIKILDQFPKLVCLKLVLSSDSVIRRSIPIIKNNQIQILNLDIRMKILYSSRELDMIYNLALNFPHLPSLHISKFDEKEISSEAVPDVEETRKEASQQYIKLDSYFRSGKLHKSNAWTLLPHLARLVCTYTRHGKTQKRFCSREMHVAMKIIDLL